MSIGGNGFSGEGVSQVKIRDKWWVKELLDRWVRRVRPFVLIMLSVCALGFICYVIWFDSEQFRYLSHQVEPFPHPPPTIATIPKIAPTIPTLIPTIPTLPSFPMFHTGAPPDLYSTSVVDDIVKRLDWGQIAFNAPKLVELGETFHIELLLSLTKSIEDLKRDVKEAGEKEGFQVRVSSLMEAQVTGQGFQITAKPPVEQTVDSLETAVWKWDVKAIEPGLHVLHLTLWAVLSINGKDRSKVVKTFDHQLEIRVSMTNRVRSFMKDNWQWLWTAILVPVAGAIWAWWRHRKKTKKKKHS